VLIVQKRFGSWTALERGILRWKAMNFPQIGKEEAKSKGRAARRLLKLARPRNLEKKKAPASNRFFHTFGGSSSFEVPARPVTPWSRQDFATWTACIVRPRTYFMRTDQKQHGGLAS